MYPQYHSKALALNTMNKMYSTEKHSHKSFHVIYSGVQYILSVLYVSIYILLNVRRMNSMATAPSYM